MKKILLFLFLSICNVSLSFGQATLPLSRTAWVTTPTGWTDNGVNRITSFACSGNDGGSLLASGNSYKVFFSGVPNQLTYSIKGSNPTTGSFNVQESPDGITWTDIIAYSTISGGTCINETQTLLSTTSYVQFIYINKTAGNVDIDDIAISANVSTPVISLNPTTLTGLNYVVGSGPSSPQTFTASGINLTANISLVAPTNFEISLTSGGVYSTNLTLTRVGSSVATTTIYVRLKTGLTVGTYTGNVTADTTGAIQKMVALTGNVTGSQLSDLVAVAGSSPTTISSTINTAPNLTSATGIQVWQFKVRDGGASLNDLDTLPTILNAFTIAQASNSVSIWSDAINTIALFDGATWIANGVVTSTTITFSGLSVSVADNTEKTLSLRLSLKCPLGPGALDNDHFGFSISNGVNTTFSAAGSGKTAFTAIVNTFGTNNIDVTATRLLFTTQPTNTGVNGSMTPSVKVRAVDACGNLDSSFTGAVSITSTGTLNGSPLSATAVAGVATFLNVIHSVVATGLTLNATSTGLTSITSTTFDILNITTLKPGDIAILAFNSAITTGEDEISFVTFVDILPETTIDMTDNAYQKCNPGSNGWGISEGWIRLVRKNSTLLKGSIVTVRVNGGTPSVFSPDPSNWTCSKPQPSLQGIFDLNSSGEQIFFMSGGNVGGLNASTAASDGGTYSGYFLYGFNTKGNIWTPICAGGGGAGGTRNSDKPANFDCFLVWPTVQADLNKYTGDFSPASQRDWIARITDSNNWTGYVNNAAYSDVLQPDFYGGSITIITGGYSNGVWIGNKNTNWFDCGNWQSFKVPDQTVNVSVDSNSTQAAVIDFNAPYSDNFLDIAKCNNLTISNLKVQAEASANNVLEVNGNLTINTGGILDMDDSNVSTADGVIKLFGNWTNNAGNAAFQEGNSTVQFVGIIPQIISNVTPEGTETFYDVVLGNNFDTSVSNNLIASGNLTVNATKTLSVASTGYVRANKNLINNGNIVIDNSGQLIQVDEVDGNSGTYSGTTFQVKRTASVRNFDYVYWSSPIDNFAVSSLPTNNRYEWNTIYNNTNGTQGNWVSPAGDMVKGKGYIARASNGSATNIPLDVIFQGGKPRNGMFTSAIQRGNYTGADYDAETSNSNNVFTTRWDDNWNLIGNPYPSSINAMAFLSANSNIEGFVNIWTHQTLPVSTVDPFYQDFVYNYTPSDYISHNGTGTVSGPSGFNGNIASGQGFFVLMSDGSATTSSVTFSNSMRRDITNNLPYSNSQFYRNSASVIDIQGEEKDRIWLDIVSPQGVSDRTLVGYVTNATNEKDRLYDAVSKLGNSLKIVSYLDNENPQEFCIQGRSLPFNENDTVKLGVVTPTAEIYTIAIGSVDGFFEGNQTIYLEDTELNVIHNLNQSPYSFTSTIGANTNRFVLRYINGVLGTNVEDYNNSVQAIKNNNQVVVRSVNEAIKLIEVYDILGREIAKVEGKSQNEVAVNNITISNQALLIKVQLENGQIVTRKILF